MELKLNIINKTTMQQFSQNTASADAKNLDGFFMVMEDHEMNSLKKGDIFELWEDDRSSAPRFRNIKTKEGSFVPWCFLAPAPKGFWYGGLAVCDNIKQGEHEYEVIEVLKNSFMIATGAWFTYEQAISHGWKILEAEEPKTKIEEFKE